ncbi:MAG: DDE-type integrase/transposase/recombinase [Deltaproteobacteria bacterium]|nr:DDE-type integrase/transposase/recombinase [Deltaproteobacteria bacterium]
MLDVFSRYAVGWMVAHRESAKLAQRFSASTFEKQGMKRDQLTIYADRGTSMRSKPVALLLPDVGVTRHRSTRWPLRQWPRLVESLVREIRK